MGHPALRADRMAFCFVSIRTPKSRDGSETSGSRIPWPGARTSVATAVAVARAQSTGAEEAAGLTLEVVVDFDQTLERIRWFEQSKGLKRRSGHLLSTKGAPYATCR